MSFSPQPTSLVSPVDDKTPVVNLEPIDFTVTAIRRNVTLENGLLGRALRVVNNDSSNSVTVRLHSPNGVARIVPANSELTIRQWFGEYHIIPDAITGSGQIEVEAVLPKDAELRRR